MPLPSGLTTVLVTDTYCDMSGKPLGGTVTFTPTWQLSDSAGNVVFPLLPVTATVSQATGTFSVRLPCTDNGALGPAGWAYVCDIGVPGVYAETFTALFPSTLGASVQLRTVAPIVPPGPPVATAVSSVNGQIGAVELTAFAVGADASGAAAAETARAEAAEALLVPLSDLPLSLANLPLTQLDTRYTGMLANQPIIPSTSAAISYTGSWTQATGTSNTHNAAGVSAYASTSGATATCTFTGTGIQIWGNLNPGHGQANVAIDGGSPVLVDTYAASSAWTIIYKTSVLAYGTHTVVITILGTKNVSSTGTRVQFDSLVPVNQQSHLPGTVFNVMDPFFGAAGDGVTDDTIPIQGAVTAAIAASGAVYFPGTANWYHTTAPVTASGASTLSLFGDGYRSCIKASGNYDIFQFASLSAVTITSIRLDTELSSPTSGYGFKLTSCSNMYFLWVMTADVWDGVYSTGSDTITMFGCFLHGVNAGTYTQNAIHAVASQFGGGTYGIDLDSTSGSCSFMSCAFFGPVSLVTHNSLSRTNPNKGLTFFNSGSNFETGNGPPPEGNGGIDLNYCAGNVILSQCYNAGSGLRFGLNVTTFDTLHIVGGEYGGSGASQPDGIVMSKGSHITIHGAKLGGTANTSSDIISIASAVDSVVISGNHFIGTCNYAVNSAATGTGTGEIIIRDNDFTGIISSPNLSAGTYVNVPPASIASYSTSGNTSGLVTTRASRVATLAAVSNVYTPSRDTMDEAFISAPSAAFTIAAPTGTALDGDRLIIRVRSGSTAYAPTWITTSGGYEGSPGLPLPSAVTVSAEDYMGFKYSAAAARFLLVAYTPGFS